MGRLFPLDLRYAKAYLPGEFMEWRTCSKLPETSPSSTYCVRERFRASSQQVNHLIPTKSKPIGMPTHLCLWQCRHPVLIPREIAMRRLHEALQMSVQHCRLGVVQRFPRMCDEIMKGSFARIFQEFGYIPITLPISLRKR